MKCLGCGTNNTYRDRAPQRTCKRCGQRFAFEPRAGDPLTDPKLLHVARRLSEDGALSYTTRQLWYATARNTERRGNQSVRRLLGRARGRSDLGPIHLPRLGHGDFVDLVQRWEQIHGPLPGHVDDATLARDPNRQVDGHEPAEDLLGFGVERVLVVDRSPVAQMLVANRFHVEQRCAVFSVDGYPERIRDALWAMVVAAGPEVTALALHDATAAGADFARRLRLEWFPHATRPVIDVALRPSQVRRGRVLAHAAPSPSADIAPLGTTALAPWEEQWLSGGGEAELEALGPSQILTVLRRHVTEASRRRERSLADSGDAGAAGGDDGRHGVVIFWGHDDLDPDGGRGDDVGDGFDGDG